MTEIEEIPIIRSMQAVKEFFFASDSPKFTLWGGYSKDRGENIRSTKDEKNEDVQLAWEQLERALSWSGYRGSFTLLVTASKNGTGGGRTARIALKPSNTEEPSNAAIGNIISGDEIERRIQQALTADRQAREIDDLKAQIQGLANAKPEKVGAFERMFEKALDEEGSGNEMIKGIADGVRELGIGMKYFMMSKAGAANGQRSKQLPPKRTEKQPENQDNDSDGDADEYDGNEILQMLEDTETLIPDLNPLDVHKAMIKMFAEMGEAERAFLIENKLKPNL